MYDLHIERAVNAAAARQVLCDVVALANDEVLTFESFGALADAPSGARLLAVVFPRARGFRTSVSLYPQDHDALSLSEADLAVEFCRRLQTRCLIVNDCLDPYVWTLVCADGSNTRISVDVEALDQDECLVLATS